MKPHLRGSAAETIFSYVNTDAFRSCWRKCLKEHSASLPRSKHCSDDLISEMGWRVSTQHLHSSSKPHSNFHSKPGLAHSHESGLSISNSFYIQVIVHCLHNFGTYCLSSCLNNTGQLLDFYSLFFNGLSTKLNNHTWKCVNICVNW